MSEFEQPATVRLHTDIHTDSIVRKNILDQLRPFQQTKVATVEIVFVTHIVNFLQTLDAIKVEMIDGAATAVSIFID